LGRATRNRIREVTMHCRSLIGAIAVAALTLPIGARAAEEMKYPDWRGAWARFIVPGLGGQPSFDQTKPWGFGQQAPLTPEYKKVLEESLADQANGGEGNFFDHAVRCYPGGMPLMTIAFRPLEFVVTPESTYILIGGAEHYRRIFTDGRDWPEGLEPTYAGYSIGRWVDTDRDGTYDLLEVETRGPFKGPRAYDATGLPLAFDNKSIFKERIFRDKADPKILHDEVSVIDHALTRPWTVDKRYVHNPKPDWDEAYCTENPSMIAIGNESYFVGGDGFLMPVRKNQTPPDLRYFKKTGK
jgi:hypothetical protein